MLIKDIHLRGIADGSVSVAFRKWKKSAVKEGILLKTPIGLVKVEKIEKIDQKDITEEDVRAAGYEKLEEVIKSFYKSAEGQIYRIELKYHGEDPRIKLRENVGISVEEMGGILEKLERYDKFSKQGNWTETVLRAIGENPKLSSGFGGAVGKGEGLVENQCPKVEKSGTDGKSLSGL